MPSEFYQLWELLTSDIYTDAPEYSERVQRIRELLPKVKFSVERVAEYLAESHATDKANNHYGDGPDDCSYCDAVASVLGPQDDDKPTTEGLTRSHCLDCEALATKREENCTCRYEGKDQQ